MNLNVLFFTSFVDLRWLFIRSDISHPFRSSEWTKTCERLTLPIHRLKYSLLSGTMIIVFDRKRISPSDFIDFELLVKIIVMDMPSDFH